MTSHDFHSISKLEASNETFFPSRSSIEAGRAPHFCIFALVRTGDSYGRNHTWIGATHTSVRTSVDSKSFCNTRSTIEPRRTSNFVCYRTNFPSKRMIRVSGSSRRSIRFFSRNNNIIPSRYDKQGHCRSATIDGETRSFVRLGKFNFRFSRDEFFYLYQNAPLTVPCR